MAVHPVTPMDEADVCRHLARQTTLGLGLVDLVDLKAGRGAARLAEERARGPRIVALDVIDEETLAAAGALIWRAARASSSARRASSTLSSPPGAPPASWRRPRRRNPSPRSSGSPSSPAPARRSPPTQIDRAEAAGFEVIALEPARSPTGPPPPSAALAALARAARRSSPPPRRQRPRRSRRRRRAARRRPRPPARPAGARGRRHPRRHRRRRHLEPRRPRPRPRRADSRERRSPPARRSCAAIRGDGSTLEIALKGGQMGPPDFFVRLRDGQEPKAERPPHEEERMTKIALMGAGGKMGVRLATNLMGSPLRHRPRRGRRGRPRPPQGRDRPRLHRAGPGALAAPTSCCSRCRTGHRRGRAPDRPAARPRHRRHRARRRRAARRRDARARRRHLLRHPPLPPADLQRRDRPGGEGRLLRRRRAPSSTSSAP